MNPRRCSIVLFLSAFLLPPAVSAQSGPVPGDTVRVHPVEGGAATGVFQSASADGVRLLTLDTGYEVLFSPAEVDLLERSVGKHRRFARNFAMAVGIGAVAGGALGAMTWSPCTETGFMACFMHPSSRGEAFGFGAVVGAVIGIPIGVIAGLTKQQRWEPVRIPGAEKDDDRRIAVQPIVGHRVGFQLSLPVGNR